MSTVEFPYTIYKEHKLPMVPLRIKSKDKWHEVWMFVDSGATYSILSAKESGRLDIDHKTGEKIFVKVGDGAYISVYLFKLPVKIDDVEFKANIGFSEELGIGFNIMGRKDFFEKFTICFSDKEKMIQFVQ